MKLVLTEPKQLTDSISIISELVNEVRLKIDKEKIELIAMDPANVAMIVFNILSSAFAEYNIEKPQDISINLDQFKQILKRAKPSDVVTIELDEDKNKLNIQIKGESTRTFNISLLSLVDQDQKVPNLKFPVKIQSNTLVFNEAIEDMGVVAESVAFLADKDKFTIKSESKLNDATVDVKANIEASEKTHSKYSLEYLKKIIKGSKLTDTVNIQFGNDYPLRIDYTTKDKLNLAVILAPRVSND